MRIKQISWYLLFVIAYSTCLSRAASANDGDSVNIALIATKSTSYVSPWETIDAVNDGFTTTNSNDKSHGAYGNWDTHTTYQWVQYTWNQEFIIKSAEIFWFDDNGGVRIPTTAYLQYFKEGNWSTSDSVLIPCVKNKFNLASMNNVKTSKIRVMMKHSLQSTGILEFRVWGTTLTGSIDIQLPVAPGTPLIMSKSSTSIGLKWPKSKDNTGIAGYQIIINDKVIANTADTFITIENLNPEVLYLISVKAVDASGNQSKASGSVWFSTSGTNNLGKTYQWSEYLPALNYNFKNEFPAMEIPAGDLDDCNNVTGTISDRWWTFKWGSKAKSLVTEAAIRPMLEKMNTDFAYFRDTLGWPPDKRAKHGYRSAIYLYGSGLCTDSEDSTALGGWQGSIDYKNESWPMVLLSYYPVYSFDPKCKYSDRANQMEAVVHEGIHSVLADLPGCKQSAWFHEGGNTWLQQEAASRRSGNTSSMGFLNGCTMIAPFMPIECYSGWLQDDSYGGPSAEGVDMFKGNQQICTWRKFLGGTQYGNTFPSFLSEILGSGSIAWIWRYCPGRVLEGMADSLGDMQMRRLIMEYRSKQALIDMGKWSNALKDLVNSNFGSSIGAEWQPSWKKPEIWNATPYVRTMNSYDPKILIPEYRTTPGWSGANQIPLNISGMGDTVLVNFMPDSANMTCQLCYRSTDGTPVYGIPVSSGECSIVLKKRPANDVVIAVISNTNYVYEGEQTRKAHYTYKLQLVKGIYKKASVYKRWYEYTQTIKDVEDPDWWTVTGIKKNELNSGDNLITIYPNPVGQNGWFCISSLYTFSGLKNLEIFDIQGKPVYKNIYEENEIELNARQLKLKSGFYIITIRDSKKIFTKKLIIN